MERKFSKLSFYVSALLFLALIVGLAMPLQTVWAATLCVEPSGAGGCYTTIQAAIDAASPGDTINVAAGTYPEVNITVNKSVTIIGDPGDASAGPGPGAPIIDGGSAYGDAFLLDNGVSNVTIQGFEIRNFVTISGDYDGVGNAISAWEASTSNITIQDNYFHDLGYNGVLVGNDGAAGDHTNWLIKGNIIEDFGYIGFELTNTSNSSIEDNVIHMSTPYIGAIFSSARRSETGLTVKNNLIDGTPSTLFPVIYMYAYDLDMANPNLDSVLVEGNTIATVGTPFQVYMRNIGTGTVTNVQVHKNSLMSLKNLTATAIDATANWWGAVSGPGTGAVSGNVDYDPWYVDAAMTILSDVAPTTVYVDATYTSGSAGGHIFNYDAFATIQEGVTAVADGGTVNVAAGTYTEQVTITKSLHLVGAGAGSSIIAAPATLPASSNATSSIILISGSGVNAELDGFTVAGPGPSACGSIRTGIYVYDGANANIHHNTIQDIRDSTFSGCQNGVAIAVGRQAWATTGTAVIDHNTIISYQKGGIVVDNAGSNATITNNTVAGIGTTSVIAQNGIQVSRGATATLSGNTVTGNSFHLDGSAWDWGSAGILLYEAGAVTMSGGNTVSGNDQNLYISSATTVTVGADSFGPSTAPLYSGYEVINYTGLALDLTSATFPGELDNCQIEERIWHGVDDTASGLVTWIAGNLYVASPESKIQNAVDKATAGDTINVCAGTYAENVSIPKAITLKGAQFGVNVSGRTAASLSESTIQGLVTVNSSDVNINGFTLTNPGQTYALSITPSSSNIAITYNIVDTVGAVGLAQNVHAIVFQNGADSVTIAHNRFNNIKAGTKSVSAIGVLDSVSTDPSTGLLIQGNTFTDIASGTKGAYGVILNNGAGVPGAQIKDNTFSGLSGGWTHAIGLEGPTPSAIVTGNIFSSLTAAGADNAAILFEKNPVGDTVTVSQNQFNGTAFYGVAVHPNDLPGGLNGYNYTVIAESNWWDMASGPGIVGPGTGTLVGLNVDFTPWLCDGTDTDPAIGFQPNLTNLCPTIKVHIAKYLDGTQADATSAGGYQFPMFASWSTANIGSGSGNYVLGNGHGGAPLPYQADTAPMTAGADYTTSEVTSGDSKVRLTCGEGAVYRLAGYKTSLISFSDAFENGALTDAPTFTGLTADQYIVVLNEKCPTLTVVKVLIPSTDTGKFNLTIDSTTYATNVGDGGMTGAVALNAGTHTVGETAGTGTSLTNYLTTIGGDCASDGTITLALGENKTCTITNTKANPNPKIAVDKQEPVIADASSPLTYNYLVSNPGNVPLSNVGVSDNKCAPVNYSTGDNGNALLDPGETWTFTCTYSPSFSSKQLKNTAKASGNFETQTAQATDNATLTPFQLQKMLYLYWDESSSKRNNSILYSAPDNTIFTVNVSKGGNLVGTYAISKNNPLKLWLSGGEYTFEEVNLPDGYLPVDASFDYSTSDGHSFHNSCNDDDRHNNHDDDECDDGKNLNGWTFKNVVTYDLAIEKTGPDSGRKGKTVTYNYTVTNSGPASVRPKVTDGKCKDVKYVGGDTDHDGRVDPGETWTFKCNYKVDGKVGSQITNTATVKDAQQPKSSDLGGDINANNNKDSWTLTVIK